MKFSIIVVCLNPGTKLNQTLDSILAQTCPDFEVIVKDGGSRDGSIESMRTDGRIHLYQEPDHSIYEAMNQTGDYILFLNCGDLFYDKEVLAHTAQFMEQHPMKLQGIYYGDTYSAKTDTKISSPPRITGFVCYRNIPCHQSCFCADRSPTNQNTRSAQIMNIFCGAITGRRLPCSIWGLPYLPTKAAATPRQRRT